MWRPWVFSRWQQPRSLPFRSASALAVRETLFPTPSTVGMTASSDMPQLPWRLSPQMEKTPNRRRRASPNNRKRPPINHHKRYSKVPENVFILVVITGGEWIYVQCFYNSSIGVTFNQIVANLGARYVREKGTVCFCHSRSFRPDGFCLECFDLFSFYSFVADIKL